MSTLLQVGELSIDYHISRGTARAVDRVSFSIERGRTLALVGESGSGKSTIALGLLRLIRPSTGRIAGGSVRLGDTDLLTLTERQMQAVRGVRIGAIFQDPTMALNPVYTIGRQIAEPLLLHGKVTARTAMERAVELLTLVGVPAPADRVLQYPHNLSGGMRQRVMIAMALACGPSLLIADEPTTALDVTVQAQVLALIAELKARLDMAVLLITHDLAVVSQFAERVIVLYAGRVAEEGPVREVFADPRHPYTRGLLASSDWSGDRSARLREIAGTVPQLDEIGAGCAFATRCPHAIARCRSERPGPIATGPARTATCFFADGSQL